jgi:Skp family chaperone for outer membrane proteins
MTKFAIGTALAALALAVPGAALAQRGGSAAVLIVDTDRIMGSCTACVAANAQLQSMVTSGSQRAQQLRTPLETEAQAIDQAAAGLRNQPAGAARTAQENALRQRVQALETRQNQANQELQRLDQNLQSIGANVRRQIGERLTTISNQVMTQRGAVVVLAKGSTLANADSIDVTNDVLTALNQQLPSVSVTPLPQQQQQQQQQPQRPQGR